MCVQNKMTRQKQKCWSQRKDKEGIILEIILTRPTLVNQNNNTVVMMWNPDCDGAMLLLSCTPVRAKVIK